VILSDESRKKLNACVHCGFCLEYCPTYKVLRLEQDSPRGRLVLMSYMDSGKLKRGRASLEHLDRCMFCRTCEQVCPSGVMYGDIIADFRSKINVKGNALNRIIEGFYLELLKRPSSLRALINYVKGARVNETNYSGAMKKIIFAIQVLKSEINTKDINAIQVNLETKSSFVVHRGCIMEGLYPDVNRRLERITKSKSLDFPCCGLAHYSEGKVDDARRLALENINLFNQIGADYIVTASSNCASFMKEYERLLGDVAKKFSSSVLDVYELLYLHGIKIRVEEGVTIHDSCHSSLHSIPKIAREVIEDVEEMESSSFECGAGGSYFLYYPEIAEKVSEIKCNMIGKTKAKFILVSNPICMAMLSYSLSKKGINKRVLHPIMLVTS
jgi:glycolate oxidase iron-sulfur subunit